MSINVTVKNEIKDIDLRVNTDENIVNTVIHIDQPLIDVNVNPAYQLNKGDKGDPGNEYIGICGETIRSYKPISVINGLVYEHDATKIEHLNAFKGFSKTSGSINSEITIVILGTIKLQGWNLVQGKTYIAGGKGILTDNDTGLSFNREVGYAEDSDSLKIINNSPIKL